MSDFHFLRPAWLAALVPMALLAWRLLVVTNPGRSWRGVIAPHLLPHLLVGRARRSRGRPATLLILGWIVAVAALAGPSWRREASPFGDETEALVIVLKVTPSMRAGDVQPSRLTRAVQKVHDLLALRPGARAGLVAYSGSAHRVLPLTDDAGIVDSFASELAPEVMPVEGDVAAAALGLASDIVEKSDRPGRIVWVCDAVATTQSGPLSQFRAKSPVPVSILAVVGDGTEFDTLPAAITALDATLVRVTPDDADVRELAADTNLSSAADEATQRWQDAGYWLVPIVAAISLLWFRPGWVAGGVS